MRSDAAWRAMQDAKRGPSCRDFNGRVPIGTPVRYWTGPRTGPGVESKTRTEATRPLRGFFREAKAPCVLGCSEWP